MLINDYIFLTKSLSKKNDDYYKEKLEELFLI